MRKSTRAWVRAVFTMVGFVLALVTTSFGSGAGAQTSAPNVADYVEITGLIDPPTAGFLIRQIEAAGNAGSSALVVRLDTEGALGASVEPVLKAMVNARAPVIVWVGPGEARAKGAGALIALTAHYTAMSRGASLGPVEPLDLKFDQKIGLATRNDTSSLFGYVRTQRPHLGEAAEAAIASDGMGAWNAERLRLIDATRDSMPELLQDLKGQPLDLRGQALNLSNEAFTLRFMKMGLLERLAHSAARPEYAYLLLLIGVFGLLFELYNPGIGFAGVGGGVALMFAFYSLTVLPTSWAGVALLVAGLILLILDLRSNRLGPLTAIGFAALLAGSFWLFAGAHPALTLSWWVIALGMAATAIFFLSVMTSALKARTAKPVIGTEGLVGSVGVAKTDISPDGQVLARGTLWRAQTLGAAIGRGTPIKVKGIKGLTLMVEASGDDVAPSSSSTEST